MQNAKIVNNGFIMAEEGTSYDPTDRSRASSLDPGQPVGPEGVPRSTPSMFTAINRHHEGLGAGPGDPAHAEAQHEILSGTGQLNTHVMSGGAELNVLEHLNEWEGTRIADCLGGAGGDIQGFSYGEAPESNVLFGQMAPQLDVWRA